ncbi:MAG: tRNA preQ1(34) S-adenosylmethionine ribosyltransferase-isomerase QueA [Acidaminococcales bacterium]|jgi:S-adenosylmethionine:tRNA ribosyltransferase-isomerase|nr:tRNA preQ1(34) S-adenosylmethionine ribosyltransferase-isomerase QueA [Acidaminococcales bacterium]
MFVKDFDYYLPADRIAQTPANPRDHSRLLVLGRQTGAFEHRRFYDLTDYLKNTDILVFNNTKVIPARLFGRKSTGARIEVLLLRRLADGEWEILARPGKKAKPGDFLVFGGGVSCQIIEKTDFGGRIARFDYEGDFAKALERLGEVPLPPYIHTKMKDASCYQTVYAKEEGSAAAPTAGLHFTEELLAKIKAAGIKSAFVTLHVGLGTFRPVSVENVREHVMHSEYYSVDAQTAEAINAAKKAGGRVIAVGTTSARVLESVGAGGHMRAAAGQTDIFIYPGYQFKTVDALVTNFHLPQSTLIMLTSAFCRREFILSAYREAIGRGYRFFSFGDAMLII